MRSKTSNIFIYLILLAMIIGLSRANIICPEGTTKTVSTSMEKVLYGTEVAVCYNSSTDRAGIFVDAAPLWRALFGTNMTSDEYDVHEIGVNGSDKEQRWNELFNRVTSPVARLPGSGPSGIDGTVPLMCGDCPSSTSVDSVFGPPPVDRAVGIKEEYELPLFSESNLEIF